MPSSISTSTGIIQARNIPVSVSRIDTCGNIPVRYTPPVASSVAENLRALREKFQMTQPAFAELCGVKQPQISKWEKGTMPDAASLMKISLGTKLPLRTILKGVSAPFDAIQEQTGQRFTPLSQDRRPSLDALLMGASDEVHDAVLANAKRALRAERRSKRNKA